MPALNFQKQFAGDVESGKKHQTIRATRKNPVKAGDALYLYTGMRTKYCRKLRDAICKEVFNIEIKEDEILLDGVSLTGREKEQLATDDGLNCLDDMIDWFGNTHGLPFKGQLIVW